MNVLFDHGTPAPLRTFLKDHTVKDAKSQGWDTFGNGDLLVAAETAGFDVLLTTDRNIRYQQNLVSRRIAIVVLSNAQWPLLRLHVESVAAAINAAKPGTYTEVDIPFNIPSVRRNCHRLVRRPHRTDFRFGFR